MPLFECRRVCRNLEKGYIAACPSVSLRLIHISVNTKSMVHLNLRWETRSIFIFSKKFFSVLDKTDEDDNG